LNKNLIGVENVIVVHVTDVAHRFSNNIDVIELGLARNFTADYDDIALCIGLARHATLFVYRETRIKDGIGNGIANFVRVAFTHGFGSKDKTTEHVKGI
jgi:hypothetical protein